METYPVDSDPEQVVRWLMAERQVGPLPLQISARRGTELRDVSSRMEWRMGDEEREDLSERAAVAVLDIAPTHVNDGWALSVIVEDEVNPGDLDEEESAEEEQIDLDTFFEEYIRPRRGTVSLVAEVEGPEAQARLEQLLGAIETNSHPADYRRTLSAAPRS